VESEEVKKWIPAFAGMTKWAGMTKCVGIAKWGHEPRWVHGSIVFFGLNG